MLARIPAPDRDVDASAEGDGVVDDHDLLVVAGADRVDAVELQVDALVRHPIEDEERCRPATQRLKETEVPLEDMDVQLGPAIDEGIDEWPQHGGPVAVFLHGQLDPGVEIPTDEQDGPAGLDHRRSNVAK